MEKTYNPQLLEPHHTKAWEDSEQYRSDASCAEDAYAVTLPPPNITGTLHMGHAFQVTVMDCLCRYQRMCGRSVLWQPGIDHAGIATQMVVERQLNKLGKTRKQIGREEFIKEVWKWKEQSGGAIKEQLKRLGASLDWSRERFTMDPEVSTAVTQVFVKMYRSGLIYRGKKLVNWDPGFQTAISDLEVLTEEEQGHLWYIHYPFSHPDASVTDKIVVATTRPETLFGDVAVAVNPQDKRYAHLIGTHLSLPLTQRAIEIIGDEYVDSSFGTGCVKITPAHDFNDYEIGQRHELPQINILNPDATLNEEVPQSYRGLDRHVARKKVLADLKELGLLEKTEDKKIMIPRGDRSGQIIEPLLTNQWFVRTENLAERALQTVKDKHIQFVPENWETIYVRWMEDIQDWCISRQLWWGHQIPAWYDEAGHCYIGENEEQIRCDHKLPADFALRRDDDVLDTWFSSALWPFVTLGWPEQTPELKKYYPNHVLVTGFDIIFFWVARMIMLGLECTGEIPFRHIYVHGLVLDLDGKKMSKSKGNILDPIDLIDGIELDDLIAKRCASIMQKHFLEQVKKKTRQQFPRGIPAYGADALRFTFMAMASRNRDIRFNLKRIEGYRNFCNKLWNATRFLVMNCEKNMDSIHNDSEVTALLAVDCWIEQRLNHLLKAVGTYYEEYRFDRIAQSIYEFVWHDYCDWYVEFCKIIQSGQGYTAEQKQANQSYQVMLLEKMLCILHPLIPFITEELWSVLKPLSHCTEASILQRSYPAVSHVAKEAAQYEQELEWVRNIIAHIRTLRSEIKIPPQENVSLKIQGWSEQNKQHFEQYTDLIQQLARINDVEWLQEQAPLPAAAIALADHLRLMIPLDGMVNKDQFLSHLGKEINQISTQLERTKKLLSNQNFLASASAEVVSTTQQQLERLQSRMQLLELQRKIL